MTSRELFDAVWNNDMEALEQILLAYPRTVDVNAEFQRGHIQLISLHVAVQNFNLKAVNWLLAAGAHGGAKDFLGNTPLHYACSSDVSLDIIKALLIAGADARNEKNCKGETPLFAVCRNRNSEALDLLVKHGASVSLVNNSGDTLLHVASRNCVENKIANILIENGADVEAKDEKRRTPLHIASSYGNAKITKLLLENGADCVASDRFGNTPLHEACHNAHLTVVKLLMKEERAEVDSRNNNGETPLSSAVKSLGNNSERTEIVRLLFQKGAVWNSKRKNDGSTPFHYACSVNVEVVRIFLDQGADTELKDGNGDTPLIWVAYDQEGALGIVQEMVSHGADWSFKSPSSGYTPFDIAVEHGNEQIVEYLQQLYLESLSQAKGRHLLLHSVLGDAKYTEEVEEEEEDDDDAFDGNGNNARAFTKKVTIRLGSIPLDRFLAILAQIVVADPDPDPVRNQDENRALPLHIACRSGAHVEVVQFLTSQDAVTLHISDNSGSLPIHAVCATSGVPLEVIKHLHEVGGGAVTLCARDHDGAMPIHLLCKSKPSVNAVQFLVQSYSKSLSVRTDDGDLPAILAITHNASQDVIFELLKAYPGALAYMKTYFGM